MSTSTSSPPTPPGAPAPAGPRHASGASASVPLRHATLPQWVPAAVVAGAAAIALLAVAALGTPLPLAVVGGVVLLAAVLWGASRAVEGRRAAKDRLVTVVVTTAFAVALLPLVSVLWTVVENGSARFDAAFFTQSMRGIVGAGGGAYHALVGTLLITAAAAVLSIPVGIMAAIYLVEYGAGRLARAVTFLVDVMTGIPSIVAGLFAYALFVLVLGPGVRLGVVGAVALSVLMIPIVIRSTEEMLKLVPNELREASYALGVPKWRTVVKVVLPTAAAGITTGVVISIARVIGETAPLLVTVGFTTSMNWNLLEGRMSTLPVFTYFSYTQPGVPPEPSIDRAWAAALVLMVVVMLLNLLARLVSRLLSPRTGR